eukprot:CAMPEP_0181406310 /NCGR_PEP_ID=MMETSP1110-20121109/5206_1 /TAXON_ID=174948 /ORGANISM="Symbiodinium sp., Strain CCMP421" /LENGTH=184 /DNA_ID=CAMNT_0023528719 /DNA_START=1925 /DNA_END=2479 /DNA_ORIENTATION=+
MKVEEVVALLADLQTLARPAVVGTRDAGPGLLQVHTSLFRPAARAVELAGSLGRQEMQDLAFRTLLGAEAGHTGRITRHADASKRSVAVLWVVALRTVFRALAAVSQVVVVAALQANHRGEHPSDTASTTRRTRLAGVANRARAILVEALWADELASPSGGQRLRLHAVGAGVGIGAPVAGVGA